MDQNVAQIPQQKNTQQILLPSYKIVQTLGSGTFGKVKLAVHIPTGENVAIKVIDKKSLKDQDDRDRVEREVEIMKIVRHPNIIQFYQKIQTDEFIYLVLELAENGELFRLMSDEVRLNERAAGRIFIQLMNAVQYLHRLGICHRDLKPENILLDVDYNIKLIDFGLSNLFQKGQYLHTACGSPCYAPPEMVSGNSYEGQIGDVWSMGIIFFGMICGSLPFEENTTKQLYKKVIDGFYFIPSDISLEATQVIRKMLVTDPKQRITIPQLRKLQFFKNLRQVQPKILGIIVGFHPMPIDNEIIQKMHKIEPFQKQKIQDQIKQNEHTKYTTLYYLIQKQSLRSGGKTIIDLQYFLESSQRYRSQYGILPEEFKEELGEGCEEGSSETIKTVKNQKARSKYSINNTKGLSKEKRYPIEIQKRMKTENVINRTYRSQKPEKLEKVQKPEEVLTTIRKYKIEKGEKIRKTEQKSVLQTQRQHRQLKTVMSSQKSRQKTSKSKQPHNASSSNSRKKSTKKVRLQNTNKLALNLWNTYFQKVIETTKTINAPPSSRGIKLKNKQKQKQKQSDKTFTNNLQKLKEGFLKLPYMKKNKTNNQDTGNSHGNGHGNGNQEKLEVSKNSRKF